MPGGGCASGESGAEEIPRSDLACGDLTCGEVAGFSGNIGESQEGRGVTKGLRGGYSCCVPGCYSNTKKNKELSFHKFPKEQLAREKWINAIKRRILFPLITTVHVQTILMGGKCGLLDIPTVFPLLRQPKAGKEPKLREYVPPPKKMKKAASATPTPLEDALVEEIASVRKVVVTLENEKASLTLALEKQKMELNNLKGLLEVMKIFAFIQDFPIIAL